MGNRLSGLKHKEASSSVWVCIIIEHKPVYSVGLRDILFEQRPVKHEPTCTGNHSGKPVLV